MDASNSTAGHLVGDPPWLTPDDPFVSSFNERVAVGTSGSDKERGLQAAFEAVAGQPARGVNDGFLRDEATLALIFVSDENDCSDDNALADDADGSLCYEYTEALVPVTAYVNGFIAIKQNDDDDVGTAEDDASATPRVIASGIVGPTPPRPARTPGPGGATAPSSSSWTGCAATSASRTSAT